MRSIAKLEFFFLLVLFWAGFAFPAFAEKRVALVIGNSSYIHVSHLNNPENDARDLSETLRNLDFDVIFKVNVDQRGLDSALEEFERKAQGADTALFFFAGHGLQYRGHNFLLPVDATIEDDVSLKYNALAIERVREALEAASGVKIMVLDACRNNPISDRLAARTEGLSRSTAPPTRGLARLDRTEGMVVAYATQADEVAQDGTGRNSPFSAALNRRLAEPNLEIATLFRRVAQDVYEQTGGKQRPELSISLLQDYYLNLRDDDSRVWRRLGSDASEAELRDFIAKFPNSPFARDAQNRLYVIETARHEEEMRQQIARQEEEIRRWKKQEEERLAADKAEKERREKEKQEAERQAILRQQQERQEAEERAARQKEAEAREQARLEKERQEAAKLAAERDEAARKAAEDLKRQRLAAEKAEEARQATAKAEAEARELKRQEAERQEAERREKEKLAADEREKLRLEVERFAAEQKEKARLAKEKQEAEDHEAKLAAEQKAEAERLEKERNKLAALEEENRRKAEAEAQKQRQTEICAQDNASLGRLAEDKKLDGLNQLKGETKCPGLANAIDQAVARIMKAQEQACRDENRALRKISESDFANLKIFAASATCGDVKKLADEKIAKIEAENARVESVCFDESERFEVLKKKLDAREPVLAELKTFQAKLSCERMRASVADAVKLATPAVNSAGQVKSAQIELDRIGCYRGPMDGALNGGVRASLGDYYRAKGFSSREIKVDDALVQELKGELVTVCKPEEPAIAKKPAKVMPPAAERAPRRPAVAHNRKEERPEPVARRHAPEAPAAKSHYVKQAAPGPTHHAAPPPGPAAGANSHPAGGGISGVGF